MPGAELSLADKMCKSSATSTLCTDCAGASPMYHVTSVLPPLRGWATDPRTSGGSAWAGVGGLTHQPAVVTNPSCEEQLCCVPGGHRPVMVLPVSPRLYNEL